MLMDFADLSAAIKPILDEKLDHYCLNETLPIPSPTSEAVAQWLFVQLRAKLPMLRSITINETCTSSCTYTGQ
jgi:6-pyruvoyltetrahydropterin/6-carboxytetrahydropterin synthase